MALLNQIVTLEGETFAQKREVEIAKGKKKELLEAKIFENIKDTKIRYYLPPESGFCVNNTFVKILKPARDDGKEKSEKKKALEPTVSFREYIHIPQPLEIIFEVPNDSVSNYFKKYLHKINYFGKRGCFFQFMGYSDNPSEANVAPFDARQGLTGLLQRYDDFDEKVTFEMVDSYSSKSTKRKAEIWLLPLKSKRSSKSYTIYVVS